MAKREERRQRRMKEALERQKQLDPTAVDAGDGVGSEKNSTEEERPSWRSRRYRDTMEDEEKTESSSSRREEKEREEDREEEEEPAPEREEEEEEEQKVIEAIPRRSNLREQEEKRKMKGEIERRRAEAAEKRQKVDDIVDGEGKPFKCVGSRGSSLKIGERAEFLNKSAQKSSVKASHSPVVSKIDNRLEQYTSAAQVSRFWLFSNMWSISQRPNCK
ncbi:hypothetical protein XENOCAPTIV_006291 [Xenoophorus captivus]|uniref:Uncharacterized protein n=1 Tax=Xenoophorus captivus TaxID=1517983 RepID=A0ABV0QW17_9TELE